MKILCVGPLWRGSNAGSLFKALSRNGCLIEVVDEFYFISLRSKQKVNKIISKIIRPFQIKEFNDDIVTKINLFKPDLVFVYKGSFVLPQTVDFAKEKGCKVAMFFPDVSMTNHGENIAKCLPKYDLVFTTKTFGIKDLKDFFGVSNSVFIPHGFDPEIHRKLTIAPKAASEFYNDVSFIGTYSRHKEEMLTFLKQKLPNINLKIWGSQWKGSNTILKNSIQGTAVTGDLYSLAIQCSKINLGLLSEVVKGSSSGDLVTSRTFHIPAAYGFMIHERNVESITYYKENEEAAFFEGGDELVEKVSYFLSHDTERLSIRENGYLKTLKCDSIDKRAEIVIEWLNKIS